MFAEEFFVEVPFSEYVLKRLKLQREKFEGTLTFRQHVPRAFYSDGILGNANCFQWVEAALVYFRRLRGWSWWGCKVLSFTSLLPEKVKIRILNCLHRHCLDSIGNIILMSIFWVLSALLILDLPEINLEVKFAENISIKSSPNSESFSSSTSFRERKDLDETKASN